MLQGFALGTSVGSVLPDWEQLVTSKLSNAC